MPSSFTYVSKTNANEFLQILAKIARGDLHNKLLKGQCNKIFTSSFFIIQTYLGQVTNGLKYFG